MEAIIIEYYPILITGSLFIISEVLPFVPQVRANGLFHMGMMALRSAHIISSDRFNLVEERCGFDIDSNGVIGGGQTYQAVQAPPGIARLNV
jgi:hypothetical protein